MNLDNNVDFYRAAGNTQFKSGAGSNTVHSMDALAGSNTVFGDLMNLDKTFDIFEERWRTRPTQFTGGAGTNKVHIMPAAL
jgi:hypothetical protein